MRSATSLKLGLLGLGVLLAMALPARAQTASKDAIGLFTAVTGKVQTTHIGQPAAIPVKLREDVFFKDVIETQAASRTKALFQDDSILTLGENSRVEVNEHVYDPANNRRSTILKLVQGRARALVGKLFASAGSKFEIHTPTAVVAARGTYFVVWIEGTPGTKVGDAGTVRPVLFRGIDVAVVPAGTTGVANIGNAGNVSFTSGGQTVNVGPGMFSNAPPGVPPTSPAGITAGAPSGVTDAISGTELRDTPNPESPPLVTIDDKPLLPPPDGERITPPSVMSGSGAQAVQGAPGDSIVPGVRPPIISQAF